MSRYIQLGKQTVKLTKEGHLLAKDIYGMLGLKSSKALTKLCKSNDIPTGTSSGSTSLSYTGLKKVLVLLSKPEHKAECTVDWTLDASLNLLAQCTKQIPATPEQIEAYKGSQKKRAPPKDKSSKKKPREEPAGAVTEGPTKAKKPKKTKSKSPDETMAEALRDCAKELTRAIELLHKGNKQ